ncbi:hypothetical protein QJS10_CPB14g01010 [Acorus calamus]|uniref:Uncharacterized protein n=1 Tax=Acorus calamus TaxID=4465 RepID=A0AAV9DC30_ACOCL|nr:hypothetical protein QJS10_CPB14g01010 [Acorus calamus]
MGTRQKQKSRVGASSRSTFSNSLSNLQKEARRAFSWAPRDSRSNSALKEVYRKRKSSGFAPTERVEWESMSGIQALLSLCSDELISAKGAIDLCVAQMKNVLSAQQLPLHASMEILGRAYYATETFVQAKWAPLSPPSKMSGENWVANGEESGLVAGTERQAVGNLQDVGFVGGLGIGICIAK